MIVEIGHFALILALAVALIQSILPLAGAHRRDPLWMSVGVPAAQAQAVLVMLAFAALSYAYVTSDFSVANVASNSHSAKPVFYKLTGVWGNHEGSMLLWVLILALFGASVATFGKSLPADLRARVLAVHGLIGVAFLLFILLTSNPFLRLDPVPIDGRSLNPILQDPGLAFHPPLLYLGYVGLATTYAFAVAALLSGRVDAAWARWMRPWTLAAWVTLTLGIAAGSWWAYYELGWGGWWFWDPVENASLMPWLCATALLHSAIVVEKRETLKAWTILLAILAFSLSLVGTFLVRSGVLTSVHAFANDPDRGFFVLLILALATGGALVLYAWRVTNLRPSSLFAPLSREAALVLNNLFLMSAMGTVFIGTLYPLALDILGGGKISVGPPFYNMTFVPLMLPLLFVMPIGPLLSWKRGDGWVVISRLWLAGLLSATAALALTPLFFDGYWLASLSVGLGLWVIAGSASEIFWRLRVFAPGRKSLGSLFGRLRRIPRSAYGAALAHAGVGVLVLGIVGTSAWQTERVERMHPGEAVELAGYGVHLDSVETVQSANYTSDLARIRLSKGGVHIATLTPERRFYPVRGAQTTEAAIHTLGIADFYAAMGEGDPDRGWVIRLYYNPLAPWIWAGAMIMALGGVLSLLDRRLRLGIPKAARAPKGRAANIQ